MTDEEKRFENNLRLAMEAQSGNEDSLDELCEEIFPLVLSVMSEVSVKNVINANSARSLGREGVIQSLKNFDPEKGRNFAHYCRQYIRNAMEMEIRRVTMTIRIPGEALAKRKKCLAAKKELEKINGSEPSIEEIAEHLDMSVRTVKRVMLSANHCLVERLDREIDIDGKGATIMDLVGDDSSESPVEIADNSLKIEYTIDLMKRVLRPREFDMVMKNFGIDEEAPWTIESIANEYGISPQRVSQIIRSSIGKIKKFAIEEGEGTDEKRHSRKS